MARVLHKLFVNLSASQTRRRLKHHGHGVRRVESVGRNQCVVIHTATGQHLRELEALLGDVMASTSREDLDVPIENLRNLGPTSASWLREVGIHTRKDLERFGPVLAFRLIKHKRPEVSLNLLWAMAGALDETDWRDLPPHRKESLRKQAFED